jgi:GT2 family glycosyltransferase
MSDTSMTAPYSKEIPWVRSAADESVAPLMVPCVYVIVLNWNGWRQTAQCLESLSRLRYEKRKIVLVDNGSEDDSLTAAITWLSQAANLDPSKLTRERMRAMAGDTKAIVIGAAHDSESGPRNNQGHHVLLRSDHNLGFAGGCNLGISYGLQNDADFLFLLNNDARVEPGTLDHLVRVATVSGASVVGARVLNETGTEVLYSGSRWPRKLFFSGKAKRPISDDEYWPSTYGEGSAVLLRRDLLEARFSVCGYYLDPALFMYCEDLDLCLYGMRSGHRTVISRDAVVRHDLASSSGGPENPRSLYYLTRNRILLANRWLTMPWKVLFHVYYVPSRIGILLFRLRRWRSGANRAAIAGLLDGYRGRAGKWAQHDSPGGHPFTVDVSAVRITQGEYRE